MRQKVALTAAHLLCEGRIADMGSGSGGASYALALLYPGLEVVGVDLSDTMVELARERHRLPNLRFIVGDVAAPVFDAGSLDGIFASSVLHHVTSFNGYDPQAAHGALAAQALQLREHGVLVVRDFVDPGAQAVWLDLPTEDGDASDDPERCATACLFERLSREFRPLSDQPGFPLISVADAEQSPAPLQPGFRRYQTTARLAAELILRKDYRADWASEVKEAYTYFTQEQFEAAFRALGLRVLTSAPVFNPWIVKHRYQGKFFQYALDGTALEPPPTNYLIVGERVSAHRGVGFRSSAPLQPIGFLQLEHYRDLRSGEVRDLVRRPNTTLDVVPWFEQGEALYVLARSSYPRPILGAEPDRAHPIDGSRACPWAVEPLSFLQHDRPIGQTIEEALWTYARLGDEQLLSFEEGSVYYPSPGGLAERVVSTFVRVAPTFVERDVGDRSGFSSSGRVQAIAAEQLLRAAQVGGLADARLELNVYDLLARQGRSWGPWLGEELDLPETPAPAPRLTPEALHGGAGRRRFARTAANPRPFLALICREFAETNAEDRVVARQTLEYVMPLHHAAVTASVALLRRHRGIVYLGLDDDDLPAAQCFAGNSNLLVTPAWRLPLDRLRAPAATAFVRARLREEYGLEVAAIVPLGGKYHPTPGATPEVVHPLAVSVVQEGRGQRQLSWIPLVELARDARHLCDGHLRVAALRAAHALGVGGAVTIAAHNGSLRA